MRKRLGVVLAALGTTIGLRTTESDITLTVEGRWFGKFDPVRLALSLMIVAMLILAGVCSILSLNGEADGGPYQIPQSVTPPR